MPSMFERTTKKLVKEIGDQELISVKCLLSATKIHRFSLIQRKKARSWFWKRPDVPLDISLMHILEPGYSVPDAPVKVSADFSDSVVRKQQVSGSVNAGAEAGFSEETTVCRGSFLECQIVSTPHETWKELQKSNMPSMFERTTKKLVKEIGDQELISVKCRKLPDPEPAILRQCREAGVNLYVVTDTVELLNSAVLQDLSSANVLGKFSIPWNIWVKGEGQAGGLKVREKKLTVPKGSVLAYKMKQLDFSNKGWGTFHITDGDDDDDDDDEYTFFAGSKETPRDDVVVDDDDDTFLADFKLLQEEVSQNVKAAEILKGPRGVVFSNLLAMLEDREALQGLMDTLELEPLRHLEGPGGAILTELRKDSRYPEVGSKSLLLYLLEALIVLSDIQHDLLAQSMEKRILLPQRDLVRSILEPNFKCFQNIPFTLQPELLAPLQGEGLVITYGLLDECGLKMELNSPRSTWDPEAKEPLSALYATLFVLRQLAEA